MATKKKRPSDGSYDNVYDTEEKDEESEENKISKGNEQFEKEMKEQEKTREEMEERKKEKLKQFKKRDEEREEIRKRETVEIGGQKTERKVYEHKRGKGIFIRGKSKNYPKKIDKIFKKKVHGVPLKKKEEIKKIIQEYTKRKTVATEVELDNFFVKLKHRKFTGSAGFKEMFKKKEREGIDIKKYKEELKKKFNKRELNKFRRAIKGKEDPLRHKMKPTPNRVLDRTGKPGSSSPMSKVGKRF